MKKKTVMDGKPPSRRTINFMRSLRVALTAAEIAQRADLSAHKVAEVSAKKDELKSSTKHQKGIIEALEGQIHELSGEVRTRSTYRSVECQQVFDYQAQTVSEFRLDTGEMLNDRKMTEAERQRDLPGFEETERKSDESREDGNDDSGS